MKFKIFISRTNSIANCQLPIANLLLCLFVVSCAIRQQPSGGSKDLVPPKILHSLPENYTTNFIAKEIRIDFDEFIDLKELNKQLVISPLMKNDPEVSVKGKSLIIKLPDSLRQNTTYTLNFGNAIVDTHESNALDDFQYVFSTGPVLDSLQVNGEVKFAENLKTEKGIVVMLYNNLSDTVVYNTLPDYFAKTDSSGKFLIKNLRPDTYK
ncbi:MAG: Ig-like domain-containing domain, partial [Bacteroidia bacterium]